MYILTDGKNYVMENPMQAGKYLYTTSPVQATEFTYKQARSLIQNKKSSIKWIKTYYMVNVETGEKETSVPRYSNEGIFSEGKAFSFDDSITNTIKLEANAISALEGWDLNQLNTYKSLLNQGLQYYDSAISDVRHARLDKRPPAHIRTKIDGISTELEEKRRDIKQSQQYTDVLIKAIEQQWPIGKIKEGLKAAKYVPYKGRTKYYDMILNLIEPR